MVDVESYSQNQIGNQRTYDAINQYESELGNTDFQI